MRTNPIPRSMTDAGSTRETSTTPARRQGGHGFRQRRSRCLAILALVSVAPLQAATFVVTRTDDPAPGGCQPGDCSLREAVLAANASPGADRIEMNAALHQLSLGVVAVSGTLEIVGTGTDLTTIRGSGDSGILRGLSGANLTVSTLTLDGPGQVVAGDSRGNVQDAIALESPGSLTLTQAKVTLGGGFVRSLPGGSSQVSVQGSELLALGCLHDAGACSLLDSAVQLFAAYGGNVTLRETSISGMLVPGIGSGASIETTGTVLIEDSEIADTFSGLSFQAGIPARTDLRRVRYLRNREPLQVRQPMVVWIEDSEFSDNENIWTGEDGGPGAIHAYLGSIFHVTRTSFIGNLGSGDAGGAILVEGNASLWLTDSTFSNNSFTVAAAGKGARGGAVAVRAGNALSVAELRHATVVAPTFFPVGVTGTAFAVLGADAQAHFAVHNSIVRGSCDLGLVPGHMDFAEGNVKSSGDSCGFDAGSNQLGVSNAQMALGSLGDFGAFAPVYQPAANSVAVDAGVGARCTEYDQRGYQRPYPGDLCDAGAVEVGADERIFADGFED